MLDLKLFTIDQAGFWGESNCWLAEFIYLPGTSATAASQPDSPPFWGMRLLGAPIATYRLSTPMRWACQYLRH